MQLSEIVNRPKDVSRRARLPIERFLRSVMDYVDVPGRPGDTFMLRIPQQFTVMHGQSMQLQSLGRLIFPARVIGQRGPRALVRIGPL